MSMEYSDPSRESEGTALPDVEIFLGADYCAACEGEDTEHLEHDKFYYWYCFPGCLPDSDPIGPFDTEDEALADAQADA